MVDAEKENKMSKTAECRKDDLFIIITKPKSNNPFDLGKMLVLHKKQLTKKSLKALGLEK